MSGLKLLGFIICIGYSSFAFTQSKKQSINDAQAKDQMIFMSYSVQKTSDNSIEITYLDNKITAGRIKGFNSDNQFNAVGNLECVLLDKNFKSLETLFIENPLKKTVEFVNDSGNLEKRMIDLDKTDFTFRMPFPDKAEYVRMQLLSNSETQNFVLTKL